MAVTQIAPTLPGSDIATGTNVPIPGGHTRSCWCGLIRDPLDMAAATPPPTSVPFHASSLFDVPTERPGMCLCMLVWGEVVTKAVMPQWKANGFIRPIKTEHSVLLRGQTKHLLGQHPDWSFSDGRMAHNQSHLHIWDCIIWSHDKESIRFLPWWVESHPLLPGWSSSRPETIKSAVRIHQKYPVKTSIGQLNTRKLACHSHALFAHHDVL